MAYFAASSSPCKAFLRSSTFLGEPVHTFVGTVLLKHLLRGVNEPVFPHAMSGIVLELVAAGAFFCQEGLQLVCNVRQRRALKQLLHHSVRIGIVSGLAANSTEYSSKANTSPPLHSAACVRSPFPLVHDASGYQVSGHVQNRSHHVEQSVQTQD